MWDTRIVLGLIHRYGEACRREDHYRAGVLYSEIVRAIQDEEAPALTSEEASAGAEVYAEL